MEFKKRNEVTFLGSANKNDSLDPMVSKFSLLFKNSYRNKFNNVSVLSLNSASKTYLEERN